MDLGLIQLYTGDGKGKTTAAFGQAIRCAGNNNKVIIFQFLKGKDSGESLFLENNEYIELYHLNIEGSFSWRKSKEAEDLVIAEIHMAMDYVKEIIKYDRCDMLVLDEIVHVFKREYYSLKDFVALLKERPQIMEVILTGRGAMEELYDIADLVTEMKKIKHPFDEGIKARQGIEY